MPDGDNFPSKTVLFGSYSFTLHGLSDVDPYFASIKDHFDSDFTRLCQRLVAPDYVCLDLGANIGTKTLQLSRLCPEGKVIAVEAGRNVAECLALNLSVNDAHNAVRLNAAVSDKDGTLRFDENSAWGHAGIRGVEVEAVTLEELVRRYELSRVDFIKIDVEGGELKVLKSSLDLINRFESLVFVEFNSLTLLVWGNTNPREFIEWVTENFQYVYAFDRTSPEGVLLTPVISSDECRAILHRNLVDDGCVTDLVMSNAAHRFRPSVEFLEKQLSATQAALTRAQHAVNDRSLSNERSQQLNEAAAKLAAAASRAELEAAMDRLSRSEADGIDLTRQIALLRAERDALLASTSWKASAPLRRLRGVLRRVNLC